MSRQDDERLDDDLRAALKRGSGTLTMSASARESVYKRALGDGPGERRRARRSSFRGRVWSVRSGFIAASGAAVALMLVAAIAVSGHVIRTTHGPGPAPLRNGPTAITQEPATGVQPGLSAAGTSYAAVTATVAPIETRDLRLQVGIHEPTPATRHGAPARSPAATGGMIELSPRAFTVEARLYNNSNRPIDGHDLQGMLFILKRNGGLNPSQVSDWEYFVESPAPVIPPHQSVQWDFTPNPAPPFHHLGMREAHLIWLLRSPQEGLPTLTIGELPVSVSDIRIRVIGYGGLSVRSQFLAITATLHNDGLRPFSLRSALAMLFFRYLPHAALLSRGTYKYFDDIQPLRGQSTIIRPGGQARVKFVITGVPGANMTDLPLSVLLVARSQIGA
ncbi:MAG: hypothetical protein OWT27_06460 [Firmicutes bacterium]|nr:hypothetical protein [Bacillota bacterium]